MPHNIDPFDHIVSGAGMGEWPDPGYETIPPYRINLLQEGLLDHMVATDPGEKLEGVELEVYLAQLQRLYAIEFEKLGILRCGDRVKLSNAGLLLCVDQEGNFGMDMLDPTVQVVGEVVRPLIMEAPLIESLDVDHDHPEAYGNNVLAQLAACVQLVDVTISVRDVDTYHEEKMGDDAFFICAPLIYPDMKVQRQIAPIDQLK